jgi:hypothetical protein
VVAATARCMHVHGTNFRTEHLMLVWRASAVDVSPGPNECSDCFALTNLYKSFVQACSCMPIVGPSSPERNLPLAYESFSNQRAGASP